MRRYLTTLPGEHGRVFAGHNEYLSMTLNIDEALDGTIITTLPSYHLLRIEPDMKTVETGEMIPTGFYSFYIEGFPASLHLTCETSLSLIEYLTTTTPFIAVFEMPLKKAKDYLDDSRRDGMVIRARSGRYPVYVAIGRAKMTYLYRLEEAGIPIVSMYQMEAVDGQWITIHRGNGIGSAFCYITTMQEAFIPTSSLTLARKYVHEVRDEYRVEPWMVLG